MKERLRARGENSLRLCAVLSSVMQEASATNQFAQRNSWFATAELCSAALLVTEAPCNKLFIDAHLFMVQPKLL